jgi:dolichol-phosphate mannosyltransferase
MNIVVILPTYNEKVNIGKMIPLLMEDIFPKIKNHHMKLLVVDDDSPDGTAEVVRGFIKKWKSIKLLSGTKNGLGAAYVKGMKYAMGEMEADAVMEIDSDFQHDPYDIPRLISAMDQGADYAIGSRYVQGGAIPEEWGIHRKLISRLGGLFAQFVFWRFDVHDMTSGFKLTKSEFLKKVDLDNLYSKYYAYKLHILHDVLAQEAKVTEVPIVFYERKEGSSKITRKDLFDSFFVVLRLRLIKNKRFVKFLIVGGTGFVLQYIVLYTSIIAGVPQHVGAGLSAEAAILSNFFLNNLWTFKDTKHIKEKGSLLKRLVKFNSASLGAIGIQSLSIYIFVKFLGEKIIILGYPIHTSLVVLFPTIILLVIPLNYFIYNKLIWKTQYLNKV